MAGGPHAGRLLTEAVCGPGTTNSSRSPQRMPPPAALASPAAAMAGGAHAGRHLAESVCGPGTTNSWPAPAPAAPVCAVGLSVTPSSQRQQ
jgi:hypothetical protein